MATEAQPTRPAQRLPTTEARTRLPQLVRKLASLRKPSKGLLEHAVEIGPWNRGGAFLVPEVDVTAAVAREQRLERRCAELEDEIENLALSMVLSERLGKPSSGGRISAEDLARSLGFEDLLKAAR